MPAEDMLQLDEMSSMCAQVITLRGELARLRHSHENDAEDRLRRLRRLSGRLDQQDSPLKDFAVEMGCPRDQFLREALAIAEDPSAGVVPTFDESDLQALLEEVVDAGGQKDPL